jgi:GDP-D-mannose dehydratase
VVATGEERSLQDFVVETFRQVDLDWEEHVESDPALFRPSDIERSCGNPSKAHKQLGWSATLRFPLIIKSLIGAAGPRSEGVIKLTMARGKNKFKRLYALIRRYTNK